MKKRSKFKGRFFYVVTLIGFFTLSLIFFYLSNGKVIKNLIFSSNLPVLKNQKPISPSQYNGWIAWWDESSALRTLNKNPKVFKSVSPVWYRIDGRGELKKIPHNIEDQISELTKENNIKLIPTLTNEFDPIRTSLVLNNTDIYSNLIESLKSLCFNFNYQGLDIDWEEINPKDQEAFTNFIRGLSQVFHQADLSLTVSVHPKTGYSDREVAKGYDYKALSESADYIKIMAYDFHNQNSEPGAITPFGDLTKVLEYVGSDINLDKVILGLPTYGYDWETGKKEAEVVSFSQATDRIKKYNGVVKRDSESNALIGSYKNNSKDHVIWYEDEETLGKMIALARSKGIYQFSFWRIGVEDPAFWIKLQAN